MRDGDEDSRVIAWSIGRRRSCRRDEHRNGCGNDAMGHWPSLDWGKEQLKPAAPDAGSKDRDPQGGLFRPPRETHQNGPGAKSCAGVDGLMLRPLCGVPAYGKTAL